jgi:hypothetical protein
VPPLRAHSSPTAPTDPRELGFAALPPCNPSRPGDTRRNTVDAPSVLQKQLQQRQKQVAYERDVLAEQRGAAVGNLTWR